MIYKTDAINNCFDDLLDIKKLYLKMSILFENVILKFLFSTEYPHNMYLFKIFLKISIFICT